MTTVLNIEGMSCGHCVKHVATALEELSGVENVTVSLEEKTATVAHTDAVTLEQMKSAVEEAGYQVV